MPGEIRIGCSGWSYPHWRNVFYPAKLPAGEHLAFYAQHLNTVELNNSFYRQPPRERFEAWREQAPPGFLFAVKGSRYVSHIKRLAVEKKSIDLVVDAALGLGDRLGPILFQLRPTSTSTWSALSISSACCRRTCASRSNSGTTRGS